MVRIKMMENDRYEQAEIDSATEKVALFGIAEEQGYEAPFMAFTWERWQEMQASMVQRFSRFQRAIHYKQANVAIQIAQEVIKMGMEWLDEATIWIDTDTRL